MKVLVVGSGGREHALCWALAASPLTHQLLCAPGNAGIAEQATCLDIRADDVDGIVAVSQSLGIDFVVVGPEGALVEGLVDKLEAAGIAAFGPTAAAAILEGSKSFTKDLCATHDIPTAAHASFNALAPALAYAEDQGLPIVIKADGLAAGKGVTIARHRAEAQAALSDIFSGKFGAAKVVIEEFLDGEEASFFALVDGEHVLELATAQDHKPVGEGDKGPNTGGMGAYSPAPVMTPAVREQVMERIIKPTVAAMHRKGRPFKGVLYAGLMINATGPHLVEYNVRFGDPECQVLMARLRSDLLPALLAARDGVLDQFDLQWRDETALTVVVATRGYPGAYEKGSEIRGIEDAGAIPNALVFHAGTRRDGDRILADGGRVLGVTALGATVAEAQARAYQAVDKLDWPEGFCRRDIGWRAIAGQAKPPEATE